MAMFVTAPRLTPVMLHRIATRRQSVETAERAAGIR